MSKHNRPSSVRSNYQPAKPEERPAEAAAVPENPIAGASPIPTISAQTTGAAANAEESLSNEPGASFDVKETENIASIMVSDGGGKSYPQGDKIQLQYASGAVGNAIIEKSGSANDAPPANDFIGWKPIGQTVTESPPRNGMPVYLSDKPEGSGVLAFWKKTKAFANATKKWEDTGKWIDSITGYAINFEPKYWRERFV